MVSLTRDGGGISQGYIRPDDPHADVRWNVGMTWEGRKCCLMHNGADGLSSWIRLEIDGHSDIDARHLIEISEGHLI